MNTKQKMFFGEKIKNPNLKTEKTFWQRHKPKFSIINMFK